MRGYVVMKLISLAPTSMGIKIDLATDNKIGMLPVFRTKKSARAVYGAKVELIEIRAEKEKA